MQLEGKTGLSITEACQTARLPVLVTCFLSKGTRIPLEHLAGLGRKGISEAEIREDYPALSHLDLAFASIHARMSPPPGRPPKPLELRRGKAA
jgi:uncharacterized protein DUF433